MKSFEISEIRVNSTDFEIRTPFWGVGDPSGVELHLYSMSASVQNYIYQFCVLAYYKLVTTPMRP